MFYKAKNIDCSKAGFFRFRKLKNKYLLTNDAGDHILLTPAEFSRLATGKPEKNPAKRKEMAKKCFLLAGADWESNIEKYRQRKQYLFSGPSLHIVVLTLRCNYSCLYCQTSSKKAKRNEFDMDLGAAKKVVDFIFNSPNKYIAIEFQGGEPLLNWPVVKFIVEYAKEKNKEFKKNLELRLVSNFSLMDDEKMKFFFKNGVTLCTSLDGPENIHNKNRPFAAGSSYKETTKWLERALKTYWRYEKYKNKKYFAQPGALVTISRYSLPYYKEIINEYADRELEVIFLRPLVPLGVARKSWPAIGYSAQEFIDFYKKSINYIFELNKKGKKIREYNAAIVAAKILTENDPNYLEMRSPCGAGIGQLAYDYNGDIYTCDEGRMVGNMGDDIFKLGSVWKNNYNEIIESPVVKTMCLASETSSLPGCSDCAYQPYCGVCPIYNYAASGNIFGQQPASARCQINKAIFDLIFGLLQNKNYRKMLEEWAVVADPSWIKNRASKIRRRLRAKNRPDKK
jgi:His-Xaa-Ser system radical SAM maturase HxsB